MHVAGSDVGRTTIDDGSKKEILLSRSTRTLYVAVPLGVKTCGR
jgi:hypothetical protein